jgi:hypothetical protein
VPERQLPDPFPLLGVDHVHDCVDQSQVRERLREVAEVAAALRVDLLGVEAERARVREQLVAEVAAAGAIGANGLAPMPLLGQALISRRSCTKRPL